MAEAIRVHEEFGDGSDKLILNPSGTIFGILTWDRKVPRRHVLSLYFTSDNRPVAEPLILGDCRGVEFIDDRTLLILNETQCLRWEVSSAPIPFASSDNYFLHALGAKPGLSVFAVGSHPNGGEGQVILADLANGEKRWSVPLPFDFGPDSSTFSSDGQWLAIEVGPDRSEERALIVCEVATGRRLQTWYSARWVYRMTFAPDGSLFAFVERGHSDESLVIYELNGADVDRTLPLPESLGAAAGILFGPNGSWLDLFDADGQRFRIDPSTGEVLQQHRSPFKLFPFGNVSVTVSANGQIAAGVTEDFTITVWSLQQGRLGMG